MVHSPHIIQILVPFDEFYGFTSGHWGNYYDPILENNGEITRGKGYISDDITNKAISFIKNSEKICILQEGSRTLFKR